MQPPINGAEERLEQVLAELTKIRRALETPAPPVGELREPKKPKKQTTKKSTKKKG